MKALMLLTAGAGLIAASASAQSVSTAQPDSIVSGKGSGGGVIAGVVNGNGTTQLSPTTFTVSHPSTGRYVLTFKKAFAKSAICTYTPVGSQVRVSGLHVTSTTCDVTFVSTSSSAVTDALFVFLAANAG